MALTPHGLVFCVSSLTLACAACLPGAIEYEQRIWINDDAGNPLPIGIFESSWDSSYLFTAMSQILIEELMGYHTTINHENPGDSGAAAHFALAGCLEWNSGTGNRKCDLQETRMHLVLDSWMDNWPQEAKEMQKYPHLVAIDLGSMGYDGVEGFYVDSTTLATAYNANGLSLNFYMSYNLTHHDPKQYFDGISSVNVSDVTLCNETNFFNNDHMKNYLDWTNDLEGVVQLADGSYAANCLDDRFWIAPACRADTTSCILTVTAGSGWGMQAFMQWATAYGIPAALAVNEDWSSMVSTVKNGKHLFYWYEPDASFAQDSPSVIIFPRHSAQAWARGERKTATKAQYVNKACSRNLQFKAPKVKDFIAKISFDLQEAQELLSLTAGGQSFYDVSCQWLRDHPERLAEWISVATSCSPGYGIADVAGAFLSSRENATICQKCSLGRFSERFSDTLGVAYRCTTQGKEGETKRDECLRGTYTQQSEQISCEVCPIGSYQNSTGRTECLLCPDDRTTLLFAAQSLDDCVCKAGTIENTDGQCVQCLEGLTCPKGSTVQLLLDGESNLAQMDDLPRVDAGYRSTRESPLDIYRCTSYCPGGVPGSCEAGRIGVTCGDCPQWEFVQSEECQPCRPVHSALWILVCPVIFFIVFFSYYMLNGHHSAKANAVQCVFACFGLIIVYCEILAVMQSVAVQWPASLATALSYFEVFGLSFDSVGLGCLAGSQVRSYVVQSFFFPVLVIGSFVMQVLTQLIPLPQRFHRHRWTRARTCNMLGHLLQEGYITMSNIAFVPFSCFSHPYGGESLLTTTNILCGSGDHAFMQVYGVILGLLCTAFLVGCSYCAWKAPSWSSKPERMACIRFLIDRFRPDVWWFGIILLVRGPILSMPGIVAANVPGLQMTGLLGIMLISVLIQVRFLPWNAPLVNVADAASSGFLLILLSIGIARLEPGGEWATNVLDIACIVMGALIAFVWLVVMIAVVLLLCRKAIRKKEDWRIINLGKTTPPRDVAETLEDIANSIHGWSEGSKKRLEDALDELSFYDYHQLCTSLMLLKVEIGLGGGQRFQSAAPDLSAHPARVLTRRTTAKPIRQSLIEHEDLPSPNELDSANGGSPNSAEQNSASSEQNFVLTKSSHEDLEALEEATSESAESDGVLTQKSLTKVISEAL